MIPLHHVPVVGSTVVASIMHCWHLVLLAACARSTHPRAGEHLRPCRLALRSSPIARGVAGRYRAKRVRNNSAFAAALWMRWPGTTSTPEPSQLHSLWVCLLLHQLHCAASALLLLRCVFAQPARSPTVGRRCRAMPTRRLRRRFESCRGHFRKRHTYVSLAICASPPSHSARQRQRNKPNPGPAPRPPSSGDVHRP